MKTEASASTVSTVPKTFKDVIRNFTPAWFSVNMGTGIVSVLFHRYPFVGHTKIMNAFSLGIFCINLILFTVFIALSACRYIMFPGMWSTMLLDPVQSLYLGCFPMAGATIINAGFLVVHQYWGFGGVDFLYVLWVFWWMDVIVSFACCFGLVYLMTAHHQHSMTTLTPLWLLPIVTLTVASTTGQLLAAELMLYSMLHAILSMGVSIVMVVIGIYLSLMVLTLYIRRLFIEGLPDVSAIMSSFIPIGPCGQAGASLLLAGGNFKAAFPQGEGSVLGDELVGRILNVTCFFGAFLLWCLAVWWLMYAVMAIIGTLACGEKMPFKLAFWGTLFPNGVLAVLTIQMASAMDSKLFRVLGAIYAPVVLVIWIMLAIPTVVQVLDGRIFQIPYVEDDSVQWKESSRSDEQGPTIV